MYFFSLKWYDQCTEPPLPQKTANSVDFLTNRHFRIFVFFVRNRRILGLSNSYVTKTESWWFSVIYQRNMSFLTIILLSYDSRHTKWEPWQSIMKAAAPTYKKFQIRLQPSVIVTFTCEPLICALWDHPPVWRSYCTYHKEILCSQRIKKNCIIVHFIICEYWLW